MGFHTFDPATADKLDDVSRYRYLSREELVHSLGLDDRSDAEDGAVVADLGSGTGFYTDEVAPFADSVRAVDLQSEMHDVYRENGVPENVELVTADVGDLPFADGELDAAFSTNTFHEFAGGGHDDGPGAETEVARVVGDGGRFVVADWTAAGSGDSGPPLGERYDCAEAVDLLERAGFEILRADERPETFLVVAEK